MRSFRGVRFQAFDQAWAEIAANFGDDAKDTARGREQLAHAVLAAAHEDRGTPKVSSMLLWQ
jgi:hypothetical protein